MYVTRLSYEQYRNLSDGTISPEKGIHVIYGENAQGKTNLLEALWLFTGGHSFRGAKDREIPKIDTATGRNMPFCRLELDFYSEGRQQNAKLMIQDGKRSSIINGVSKKSGTPLVGKVCAVIFSPEHLQLVKGNASLRRGFIDGAICQIRPGYAKILSTYKKILMQRNTLLKDIAREPSLLDTMDIWDMRMAKYGADVIKQRFFYVDRLQPIVTGAYSGISGNREEISIEYAPCINVGEENKEALLLEALHRERESDLRRGYTASGPHRDDMQIKINGMSARLFASQGQQRSAVLSMKLAEAQILYEDTAESPIILLDDVMSELDAGRQDYLLNNLHDTQVFITCCAPEAVRLMEQGKKFFVDSGRVIYQSVL